MTTNHVRSLLIAALLATTVSAVPQAPAAPSAAPAPTGCPLPGEGRGPRPGGPGGPGAGGPGRGGPPEAAPGGPGKAAGATLAQGPGRGPGGPGGVPAGPAKKRLLIWADTRNGLAQHDIGHAIAVIEELGYKSGLYDSWIRTDSNIIEKRPKMTTGDPASGGPSLCNVDAIFFLGHREIELDQQGRADLLWFVHDAGKGFVSAHTATNAFMSWPEFGDLIGGRYDDHPWGVTEAPLVVVDPNFPGMKAFGAGGTFKDEFYQQSHFNPAQTHVILSLDTSGLDMAHRGVVAGDTYAQAYAKMYGKGRVFYSALGHAPATWDDPRVQDMYLGAIKWALGLVDVDVTPNPQAGPKPDWSKTPPPAPGPERPSTPNYGHGN
jgi:type 1 glutamine amidotransferase